MKAGNPSVSFYILVILVFKLLKVYQAKMSSNNNFIYKLGKKKRVIITSNE